MKGICLNILFSFWVLISSAGNPAVEKAKEEFNQVNKTYSAEKYSVQMVYKYYYEYNSTSPGETQTGIYYKNGNESYSKIMGIETIRNKKMSLVIQNEEKIIVVSNPVKDNGVMMISLDTLIMICESFDRTELPDNQIKYELKFKSGIAFEYTKMEVFINKNNFCINKLIFYYAEQEMVLENPDQSRKIHPKLEVTYKNFTNNYIVNPGMFSDSPYVVLSAQNKYKATEKYSGYQVYNQKFK